MKKTLCAAFIYELFCGSILGLHATEQKLDKVNKCVGESELEMVSAKDILHFGELNSETNDEFKRCANKFFDVDLVDSDVEFLKCCASVGCRDSLGCRRVYSLCNDAKNETIQSYFLKKAKKKILGLKEQNENKSVFVGNYNPESENFLQDIPQVNIVSALTADECEFIYPLLNQASAIRTKLKKSGYETEEIREIIDDIYSPLEISFYEEVGVKKERNAVDLKSISKKIELGEVGKEYGVSEINALTVVSYLDGLKKQEIIREEQKQEYLNLIEKENIENLKERYINLLSQLKYKRKIKFENTNILLSLSADAKARYIENVLKHIELALADEQARKVLVIFLAINENVGEQERTTLVHNPYGCHIENVAGLETSYRIEDRPYVYFCGKMTDLFYYDENDMHLYKIKKIAGDNATSEENKFGICEQVDKTKSYWILIHELRHVNVGVLFNYSRPDMFDSLSQYLGNKFISELFFPKFFDANFKKMHELFFSGQHNYVLTFHREVEVLRKALEKDSAKEIENRQEFEQQLVALEQCLRKSVNRLLAVLNYNTQIGYINKQNKIKLIGKDDIYTLDDFFETQIELLSNIALISNYFGWFPDIEELRNVTGVLYLGGNFYIDDLNDNNLSGRWFYTDPLVMLQGDENKLKQEVSPIFKAYLKKIDKDEAYNVFSKAVRFFLDLKEKVNTLDIEQRKGL